MEIESNRRQSMAVALALGQFDGVHLGHRAVCAAACRARDAWPGGGINNDSIRRANGWIEQIAEDTGVYFLYSYETLVVNGKLPDSGHNGDGLHLTGESFGKVMTYIRTHAIDMN